MLAALLGALLAGALTTLAPCALSLLPVVVGGSVHGATDGGARRRAFIIAASLGVSVAVFTLILKASTALITIPPSVWRGLSGGLLIVLGVSALFPDLWDRISVASGLGTASATGLHRAHGRRDTVGAMITGAALGPVFTSCSPLFGYLVVTVLPAELGRGLLLLVAYVAGLVGVLLAIALIGQRAVQRLRWAADPHARWRRALGVLFIVIGVLIATGLMLTIEAWLVENSPIRPWEIGADLGRP